MSASLDLYGGRAQWADTWRTVGLTYILVGSNFQHNRHYLHHVYYNDDMLTLGILVSDGDVVIAGDSVEGDDNDGTQCSHLRTAGSTNRKPLMMSNLRLLSWCLMERFQSLASSRPLAVWNSFGVIHASSNNTQAPLLPWQSLSKCNTALFGPHTTCSIVHPSPSEFVSPSSLVRTTRPVSSRSFMLTWHHCLFP